MNQVWVLRPREDWICDRMVEEWCKFNPQLTENDPRKANVFWLMADWCWRDIPEWILRTKIVITTVHHITPNKFDNIAKDDFQRRDQFTHAYHVFNKRTKDFITPLTSRPIVEIPYWANQHAFPDVPLSKEQIREKYHLPSDKFVIGSFQRDTEGFDLKTPKLEKGPDLLADAIERWSAQKDVHVLLAGWRRQYVINRLETSGIPYTYIQRPELSVINELYRALDLYAVTARHEGGPQSLIECGLTNTPIVSTPVGIAEQVLPAEAINTDVTIATPAVPSIEHMKLPHGFKPYKEFFNSL